VTIRGGWGWGLLLAALLLPACSTAGAERSIATESAAASVSAGSYAGERQLVRRASLRLGVRELASAQQRCAEIVKQSGGYLESTSSTSDSASLQARVPAETLDQTLDSLAALGRVRQRNVSAEDVTEQLIDTDNRLKNQRLLRDRLRALLAQGGSVKDLLAVEVELGRVQTEIEQVEARLEYLKRQVALATVSVDLEQEVIPVSGPGGLLIDGLSRLLGWFFRAP